MQYEEVPNDFADAPRHPPFFQSLMQKSTPTTALIGTQLAALWVESAVVMTLRIALLSFHGTHNPEEGRRMVEEKPTAFARAGSRAFSVAVRALAERPYDPYGAYMHAASAYTASVTRKVRDNRRRLIKG